MSVHLTQGELSQADLDLLVEGELTLAQRRRIVAALDQEVDGWRRCALAFLEAQAWRTSMRALAGGIAPRESLLDGGPRFKCGVPGVGLRGTSKRPPAETHPSKEKAGGDSLAELANRPQAPTLRATTPRTSSDRSATLLSWSAAALALILAVGLGYATGFQHAPPQGDAMTDENRDGGSPGGGLLDVPDPANPNAARPLIAGGPDDPTLRLVGTVKFDGADRPLPVVSGPGLDEEWLRNQPPLLSDYERSVLTQRGWQLREDRQIITVQLGDGSRLAIPVDSLQYRYVGNRVY